MKQYKAMAPHEDEDGLLPTGFAENPSVSLILIRNSPRKETTNQVPCRWTPVKASDATDETPPFRNFEAFKLLLDLADDMLEWDEELTGFSIGYANGEEIFLTPRNALNTLLKEVPPLVVVKTCTTVLGYGMAPL
jgi:hypothetical protein